MKPHPTQRLLLGFIGFQVGEQDRQGQGSKDVVWGREQPVGTDGGSRPPAGLQMRRGHLALCPACLGVRGSRFHDVSWSPLEASLFQKHFMTRQEFLSLRSFPTAAQRMCRLGETESSRTPSVIVSLFSLLSFFSPSQNECFLFCF